MISEILLVDSNNLNNCKKVINKFGYIIYYSYLCKMIGIYKVTSPNGKIYIGQSINVERRFKEYTKIKNTKGQVVLHRSFLKYGIVNHSFNILEQCNIKDLNKKERYWQEYYNVLGKKGLNCCLTKTNQKPRINSKQYKEKISNTLKRKYKSGEIINPRLGKGNFFNIFDFKGNILYSNIDINEAITKLNLSNRSVINNIIRTNRFLSQKKFIIVPININYKKFIFNCININKGVNIPIYQIFEDGSIKKNTASSNTRVRDKVLNSKNYIYYSKKNKSHYTFIGLLNAVLDSNI